MNNCPLCSDTGGLLIAEYAPYLRVIRAEDAHFPAFYRVIWNAHAAEWTDLNPAERLICMQGVECVETVLRQRLPADLQPTKINLASLGNVVPHVHWHVIARFDWDSHFPDPVWAAPKRPDAAEKLQALHAQLPALDAAIGLAIAQLGI